MRAARGSRGAESAARASWCRAQGASVQFKAWVCINPQCGFNIKIRNGEVLINEPINDARSEPRHSRGGPGGLRPVR